MKTFKKLMKNDDLEQDLKDFLEKQLAPVRQTMIEQERVRHDQFLQKHTQKNDLIASRHDSFISQIITLEAGILGAIIIFTNSQNISFWIVTSVVTMLISIIFGIWSQNLSIKSSYWFHQQEYKNNLEQHWWTRELWGDKTVKEEKAIVEPAASEFFPQKNSDKLLSLLHLNADLIETMFKGLFIFSLFLLILHIIGSAYFVKP